LRSDDDDESDESECDDESDDEPKCAQSTDDSDDEVSSASISCSVVLLSELELVVVA
jgi:hypothetical protein